MINATTARNIVLKKELDKIESEINFALTEGKLHIEYPTYYTENGEPDQIENDIIIALRKNGFDCFKVQDDNKCFLGIAW